VTKKCSNRPVFIWVKIIEMCSLMPTVDWNHAFKRKEVVDVLRGCFCLRAGYAKGAQEGRAV